MENRYYKSLEELRIDSSENASEAGDRKFITAMQQEIKDTPAASSRRDFLKIFGYTIASTAITMSCRQPVHKAIPYLIQPEGITPGKASYYATSFFDGIDYSSVIVKVRDGRPVKIEGNTLSPVTLGGTSARMQSSVLDLYDNSRYKNPVINGAESTWEQADAAIMAELKGIAEKQGKIVLLTPSIISPSTRSAIMSFIAAYPVTEHVQYDVHSASGILKANQTSFGQAFIPSYRFDKADVIVGFDADFLGTWLSPVEFTRQYAEKRKLTEGQQTLSKHIHFEGAMSITGSNADQRIQVRPSQQKLVMAALLNEIRQLAGLDKVAAPQCPVDVSDIAAGLYAHKGRSLVVCGSNNTDEQSLVNAINYLLDSYGNTIETDVHLKTRQADDAQIEQLVTEMNGGMVNALIIYDLNPAYDYPDNKKFTSGLQRTGLTVSLSVQSDEISAITKYICPDHHYLESWNDFEVKTGQVSFAQPAIRPVFNTRSAQESLLAWAGSPADYRMYMQQNWEKKTLPAAFSGKSFDEFWNQAIHDGVIETGEKEKTALVWNSSTYESVLASVKDVSTGKPELVLYSNISVGTGKHANNPWLQELPDPVSKACWGNYVSVSPKLAGELKLKDEQLVSINGLPELPVLIQPGQEYLTLSVALGYGRENSGIPANGVGVNMFPLVRTENGNRLFHVHDVNLGLKKEKRAIARTQTHHSMEGRAIIREASLEEYLENPQAGNEVRLVVKEHLKSLYPKAEFEGYHWGMAVDLNLCTGCNACVVACSAENNIPVVGREQVIKAREMHWIRIDRYYNGNPDDPEVVRQPVMCQHCDNAPCENVCPVAATTHSNEGLNQMAYNRCIGTRYCNNNCPYKVRRFNFWDYNGADSIKGNRYDPAEMTTDLRRLVLNPDVVTRAKGVIEKCSFCVQRIQEKKLVAKNESRPLTDGEVKPACAQACPAGAIVFGNLNDKNSKVSKMYAQERNYHLLEELHTLPSVGYLTKIKNKTT
jgi:Fe-S-cluster-containing dehydrogenase component